MPASPKAQIERINQVSAMARTSWIALLGYLAFIGVTLLGVEDADFFVPSRQTQLPLVDVSIPTASFFVFAPILAAALYIYLHIILLKLWDAIADLTEPTFEGQPVGDALVPWLVNDWALTLRGGPYTPARPLRGLGNLASLLLVWGATPLTLFLFWWWSMPAHRPLLSLLLAGCFLISLATAITAWRTAHAWLTRPRETLREPHSPSIPTALHAALRQPSTGARPLARATLASLRRHAGICALAAALAWVTLVRTTWPSADNPPLARADITNVEMVALPDGWRDWETASTAFRETWCKHEGMEMAVCAEPRGPGDDPQTSHDRSGWCGAHGIAEGAPCDAAFADLDARFEADWRAEHKSAVADLTRLDLSGRDLREIQGAGATMAGAELGGARLEGAILRGARLEGADLFGARLEGADLGWARLEGADLGWARLEGADLGWARLEGANLGFTRLEGADLSSARLEEADLSGAWLEGADLVGARLEGAFLRGAELEGADLRGARLEGAILGGAGLVGADLSGARLDEADLRITDFRKSKWAGASNRASPAHFSDLRGAQDLTQAQLDQLIGNEGTLLPLPPVGAAPRYLWSCWETPPEGFDALVARIAEGEASDPASLRAEFLCGPDNLRRKTGTPLPLDAPYPEGHPLAR